MPFYAKPKNQRFPQKFVPALADRPLILIAFFNARQTRPETSEAFSFHLSPYRYLSSTHNRSTLPARSTAHWVIITANEKKPRLFSHTGTTNRQKHWGNPGSKWICRSCALCTVLSTLASTCRAHSTRFTVRSSGDGPLLVHGTTCTSSTTSSLLSRSGEGRSESAEVAAARWGGGDCGGARGSRIRGRRGCSVSPDGSCQYTGAYRQRYFW